MSKIFLTGDTHIPIDIDKLSSKKFTEGKNLTKDDYVIILGDFGLYWKKDKTFKYWHEVLQNKPWTTLWIDGNHENFDWIDSMRKRLWKGGKVHKNGSIIHLMRGQVYNIDGSTFFTMGGASSVDKAMRIPGISWWRREVISYSEMQEGLDNLGRVDNKVDFILTHTCPYRLINNMFGLYPGIDNKVEKDLQVLVDKNIKFKKWYFGHWHTDRVYGKYECLYDRVIQIK